MVLFNSQAKHRALGSLRNGLIFSFLAGPRPTNTSFFNQATIDHIEVGEAKALRTLKLHFVVLQCPYSNVLTVDCTTLNFPAQHLIRQSTI